MLSLLIGKTIAFLICKLGDFISVVFFKEICLVDIFFNITSFFIFGLDDFIYWDNIPVIYAQAKLEPFIIVFLSSQTVL